MTANRANQKFVQGLNHMGLIVEDIEKAKEWFGGFLELECLGDRGELVFYLAGQDVLAVKTPAMAVAKPEHGMEDKTTGTAAGFQRLDHYGFFAATPEQVDKFVEKLKAAEIKILKGPYDRSDGRSVYFLDPCGMICEYLYFKPT